MDLSLKASQPVTSSRRGRGNRRGVRGSRPTGHPTASEFDVNTDTPQPAPLFPSHYKVIPPASPTDRESAQIACLLSLRHRIHEGPYYTVTGDNASPLSSLPTHGYGTKRNASQSSTAAAAAAYDPFEDMPTYSRKYVKRARRLPRIDSRPYVMNLFPKELWAIIDPSYTATSGGPITIQVQNSQAARTLRRNSGKAVKGDVLGEEEEIGEEGKQQDRESAEEPVDDEFEEDEEDRGDYNGELYFDNGGEDADEDIDGEEGNGVDYY